MLTAAEIAAGSLRLNANKLKASDKETLSSVFRLYLKSIAVNYSDLNARLSALTDTSDVKTAAKLAAILIKIEDSGFAVGELSGGRGGLKFSQQNQMALQVRFALTLLGYDLPEDFSGSLESSNSTSYGESYTGVVPVDVVW